MTRSKLRFISSLLALALALVPFGSNAAQQHAMQQDAGHCQSAAGIPPNSCEQELQSEHCVITDCMEICASFQNCFGSALDLFYPETAGAVPIASGPVRAVMTRLNLPGFPSFLFRPPRA